MDDNQLSHFGLIEEIMSLSHWNQPVCRTSPKYLLFLLSLWFFVIKKEWPSTKNSLFFKNFNCLCIFNYVCTFFASDSLILRTHYVLSNIMIPYQSFVISLISNHRYDVKMKKKENRRRYEKIIIQFIAVICD